MAFALRELAGRTQPVSLARERLLPVLPALERLFPDGGLRRGATVGVAGSTSLALALLAGPSAAGSWCAAVGLPCLGLAAAVEMGIVLEHLALVPAPGQGWPAVVAALLDAFDVVVVRSPAGVRSAQARRLGARARERGAVLVAVGGWEGADLRLSVVAGGWEGVGEGHGHLRARQVEVRAEGRGAAARPRQARLWLPPPSSARPGSHDDAVVDYVGSMPPTTLPPGSKRPGPAVVDFVGAARPPRQVGTRTPPAP